MTHDEIRQQIRLAVEGRDRTVRKAMTMIGGASKRCQEKIVEIQKKCNHPKNKRETCTVPYERTTVECGVCGKELS